MKNSDNITSIVNTPNTINYRALIELKKINFKNKSLFENNSETPWLIKIKKL